MKEIIIGIVLTAAIVIGLAPLAIVTGSFFTFFDSGQILVGVTVCALTIACFRLGFRYLKRDYHCEATSDSNMIKSFIIVLLCFFIPSALVFPVKLNFDGNTLIYDFKIKEYLPSEKIYFVSPISQRAVYLSDVEITSRNGRSSFCEINSNRVEVKYRATIHFPDLKEYGIFLVPKMTRGIGMYYFGPLYRFGQPVDNKNEIDEIICARLSRYNLEKLFGLSNQKFEEILSREIQDYFEENGVASVVNLKVVRLSFSR